MTPMPVNPKIVVYVNDEGRVVGNVNNIGNDLEVVIACDKAEFDHAARGIPYSGAMVDVGCERE